MATYLDEDVFPEQKEFTPNYSLIMRTLQLQQSQYDQGFAKVKSVYNSVLNADLLGEDHKKKRDEIIANAEKSLKNLSAVDLSIPQNITSAKGVFQPFYDDDAILHDLMYTKSSKSNLQTGMALQNSDKEEDRKRYWGTGLQYIQDGMEEYKYATDEQRKGMSARRYVAKPNIDDNIMKMFTDGKIKMSIDSVSGQAMYTDENGKALKIPLMNLYMSMAENDPEAMEGFKVMGAVQRSQFARDNAQTYGSREQALSVFDKNMVATYQKNKQFEIDKINESMTVLQHKVDSWKAQANNGTLMGSDAAQAASDLADYNRLKNNLTTAQDALNTSEKRILDNPVGYLGNIYLTKNASDLASALSQFGSRKIGVNPLYKEFVFPKELELFKNELSKDLEKTKTDEKIRFATAEAEIKNEYGGGTTTTNADGTTTTTSGGAGRKQLDVPFIEENKGGSAVRKVDKAGQADAYTQQQKRTQDIISDLGFSKLRFIETVLNKNEIKDLKGNVINNNNIANLLKDGKELDRLYGLALKKHDAWISTKDPKMYSGLDLRERVKNLNDVWSASIKFRQDKLGQITNNLAGINADKDGYVYKNILKDGLLLGESDADKQIFLNNIQKTKEFNQKANERLAEKAEEYLKNQRLAQLGIPTLGAIRQTFKTFPTLESVKTEMLAEAADKFSKYRENVQMAWNKEGYYYYDQNFNQKGGGVYDRTITYQGKNEVKGEKADVFVEDLFTKVLSPLAGDDESVMVNSHTEGVKDKIKNDSDLKNLLNTRIKQDIFTAIRSGKGSDLGGYSISFSGVANSNPDFHKYTIKFDQDYINKLVETKTKLGVGLSNDQLKSLVNGIDIFVKSASDKSAMAQNSTIGEVDLLLNASSDNTLKRNITPDYGVQIEKLHTGGYRVTTNYMKVTKDNLNGTPDSKEVIISDNQDITNIYYETLRTLRLLHDQTEQVVQRQKEQMKNDPKNKPMTWDQVQQLSQNIGNY